MLEERGDAAQGSFPGKDNLRSVEARRTLPPVAKRERNIEESTGGRGREDSVGGREEEEWMDLGECVGGDEREIADNDQHPASTTPQRLCSSSIMSGSPSLPSSSTQSPSQIANLSSYLG